MKIPDDPPEEAKEARLLAPVKFLTERDKPALPEGTVHPSLNRSHIMHTFDSDQAVEFRTEEEDEPTESDLDPLLIETDPNALQGSLIET